MIQRRQLLSRLGAAAWALAWQRSFGVPLDAAAAPTEPQLQAPYSLGVASGAPRPDGMVLWTRLAPRPQDLDGGMPAQAVTVEWELAADAYFTHIHRRGKVLALPQRAHSVHVRLEGLPSGRTWHYRFRAGGSLSPVGRTRTAPDPSADVPRLRLAVASCQHYQAGHYAAHRDIAEQDLDLVMFLGDYIYETHRPFGAVRAHESTQPPRDLQAWRRRYATYKSDPALQAAHAAHPWLLMWDDHEVENDYAGLHSAERWPEAHFIEMRAQAYQAYLEHQPVDPALGPDAQGHVRLHGLWSWGNLADLWLLDERQWRSPQACDPGVGSAGSRLLWGRCAGFEDASRTMLGAAQEHWFAQSLQASTARWRLVGHGSPVSPQTWRWPGLGRFTITDGWDGYQAARLRLLQTLAEAPQGNTVLLAGDVHRHMAARLRLRADDPDSPVIGSEFVVGSISSKGLRKTLVDSIQRSQTDCLFARGDHRGYALLDVSPLQLRCEMRGTPHPVRSADTPLSPLTTFVVAHGGAGPQAVDALKQI